MGSDTSQKILKTTGLVTSTEEILDGKLHFLCSVTCEKRQENVRTQSRDASYKLKSKTCRISKKYPTSYWNGNVTSKGVGNHRNKRDP